MAFNAMWKPGPEAVAGMQKAGSTGQAALVIYLDPDSLAILPPGDHAKWPAFIRLLHEVSEGASALAAQLMIGAALSQDPHASDAIGDSGGQ